MACTRGPQARKRGDSTLEHWEEQTSTASDQPDESGGGRCFSSGTCRCDAVLAVPLQLNRHGHLVSQRLSPVLAIKQLGPPGRGLVPPRARPSQRPDPERQTHALAERCATDLVRATNSGLGAAARLLGEGMAAWCGVRLAHDGQPTTTVGGAANQAAGPPSVRPVRRLPPSNSRPLSLHARCCCSLGACILTCVDI
jgi:hypothetical protein